MLSDLNTTELLVLAQETNPDAHRGLSRSILEALAMGEDVALPPLALNTDRERIMAFITTYWKQVEPLLSCPARSGDSRSCFRCLDIQVAECITLNPKNFGGGSGDSEHGNDPR